MTTASRQKDARQKAKHLRREQLQSKRPPSTRIEIQDSVWWSHWLISATSNAAGS
ncbi:hypothetical protein RCH06_003128, partial [Polaromonas sp. CG_9.5]|nr:hypothetical protein [Polaromonas sp. CG_9.5]